MLEKISEYAKKGYRIGVFPVINGKDHEWVASVRISNSPKLTWIEGESGCQMSAFKTPDAAYKAIFKYVEEKLK